MKRMAIGTGCIFLVTLSGLLLSSRTPGEPRLVPAPDARAPAPFTRELCPVLRWESPTDSGRFRLELGRDDSFDAPILRAAGDGDRFTVPAGALTEGHRYLMRLSHPDQRGDWSDWTGPDWFVVDSRYTGLATVSPHHYPFGKVANHNLIRDGRGRLHLVVPVLESGHRIVCYAWSDDDGAHWRDLTLPELRPGRKAMSPALALSPDESRVHLAWVEFSGMPGELVHCVVANRKEPGLITGAERVSTGEHQACGCTMPAVAVDSEGVVHLAFHSETLLHRSRACYTNNREGWGRITDLESGKYNGVAQSLRIDRAGALHMLWEGGLYRWSSDGGRSWFPSLAEPPQRIFADLAEEGLKSRGCSLAVRPGEPGAVAVCAAEEILPGGPDGALWAGTLNHHHLWGREIHEGRPGPLQRIYQAPGRVLTPAECRADPDGVRYVRIPSVSASPDGRLAVAWSEVAVEGTAKRLSAWVSVGRLGGEWSEPVEIGAEPSSGSVAPFLAPTFDGELDVVWTETGHYDWRSLLAGELHDHDFDLYNVYHGIFFQRLDPSAARAEQPFPDRPTDWVAWSELESRLPEGSGGIVAELSDGRLMAWAEGSGGEIAPDERDGVPDMITLPRAAPAAVPPTGWPTSTPTVTPMPTVTPEGTRVVASVTADTYINSSVPNSNYGGETNLYLRRYQAARRKILMQFELPELSPDAVVTDARLEINSPEGPPSPREGIILLVTEPWEEFEVTANTAPDLEAITIEPFPLLHGTFHIPLDQAVMEWMDLGRPNHGICIDPVTVHSESMRLRSRESAQSPSLILYYSLATPTPIPTTTPATPVPTATPSPTPRPGELAIDLTTNQQRYSAGDHMLVTFDLKNHWQLTQQIVIWIVLEAEGEFFFFPTWDQEAVGIPVDLKPDWNFDVDLVNAELPDPLPPGGPYAFWAVVTHRMSGQIMSNVENERFWFE